MQLTNDLKKNIKSCIIKGLRKLFEILTPPDHIAQAILGSYINIMREINFFRQGNR